MDWAALVPELVVRDLPKSLCFYRRTLGFALEYERPGFAYLSLGRAQLMLCAQTNEDPAWRTGELSYPFGRGINLQIEVESVSPLLERLASVNHPLKVPPARSWYRQDDLLHGALEFLVMDPDGYLLRFVEVLGTKPA